MDAVAFVKSCGAEPCRGGQKEVGNSVQGSAEHCVIQGMRPHTEQRGENKILNRCSLREHHSFGAVNSGGSAIVHLYCFLKSVYKHSKSVT